MAPQLDGGKCVRAHLLTASCTRCAQICPVGAIDLGAGAPQLDPASCTMCGACAAVCSEQVFHMPPAPGHGRASMARFAPCPDHPLTGAPLYLASVHALGLAQLAALWARGVHVLALAPGGCPADKAPPLARVVARIGDFNTLAQARGLKGLTLRRTSAAQVRGWLNDADPPADASKRALLRRIVDPPGPDGPPDDDAAGALRDFLRLSGALYPYAPHIKAGLCTGCDDCVKVCPHAALTVIKAPDGDLVYRARAELCSGCGLCVDICEEEAVEVAEMTEEGADVSLVAYRCAGCGVGVHTTLAAPPEDGLCRICRVSGHHKALFVVLD